MQGYRADRIQTAMMATALRMEFSIFRNAFNTRIPFLFRLSFSRRTDDQKARQGQGSPSQW